MQAIKNIDPGLKLGGPSSAQNAWIPEFLAHFEKHRPPVDFVSTHYYPTDAFGKLGADTLTQLEHAPRDVMRQRAQEAHSQARGLLLYYTEWNVSSNPRDAFARPVVRSGGAGCVSVFMTNYAMPRHEIAAESARVRRVGARRPVSALVVAQR